MCSDVVRQQVGFALLVLSCHAVAYSPAIGAMFCRLCRLRSDSTLEIANLGDSGMRIVRDGQIAFATESLQHGFNMPFQLGNKNLIPYTDVPKSSLQSMVSVRPGDVIVMASDGFFDNVWDEDLARLVKHSCLIEDPDDEDCVANMAEKLALVAARNSQDQMYKSPWSVECSKQSDRVGLLRKLFPRGGKVDDITVVLAIVGES
jgi:protein phosphatase PTC7